MSVIDLILIATVVLLVILIPAIWAVTSAYLYKISAIWRLEGLLSSMTYSDLKNFVKASRAKKGEQ